jgi:choline dehydrogenase
VLLKSGVGPVSDLARLGISTRIDLPGVGRNLHDHPAFSVHFRSTPLLNLVMDEFIARGRTVYAEQSLAKARSSVCDEGFDLHIAPIAFIDREPSGQWSFKIAVANMAPRSRGRLTLRNADPSVAPTIDTGYYTDPEDSDIAVVMDGIEMTRRIARQGPLAELIGEELEETASLVSVEDVRRNSAHYYHPVGTCKMAPDSDPNAVVDPTGRVYGVDNLYVADASIIPVVPRANTNLPTLMLAEKIVASLS